MVLALTNSPAPTRERNMRSLSPEDVYLTRYIYPWSRPPSLSADTWRAWVFNQPIAMICRETLIANFLSLDWKIVARDSQQQDELKPMIRYYTKLLEGGGNNPNNFGMDYSGTMEWILTDLLDLPFGSGTELGRRDDSPTGRVLWMKPLDGGTLYPTLNKDYPIVQFYSTADLIPFPAHAIARMYMSPRPELLREGWGLAPPEKVFFALEMLSRGDRYYANLLLDIPPAGILDLGDLERDSALEWVKAFKESSSPLGTPMDAFRIPVLYEHTTPVNFIAFGKPPTDIMYDRITLKYAEMIASAYGLSLADIGMSATSNGGETLAGSIRSERKSRKTGIGRLKQKVSGFFNSILPDSLEFHIIDLDDELNVALGRARLSNATAWGQYIDKGIFSAQEARLQSMADGIITINIPEKVPAEAKKAAEAAAKPQTPRPGLLGNPVPPSSGGQGEVKKSSLITVRRTRSFDSHLKRLISDLTKMFAPIVVESAKGLSEDEVFMLRSYVDDSLFEEDTIGLGMIIQSAWGKKSWLKLEVDSVLREMLHWEASHSIVSNLEQTQAYLYENAEAETPEVPDEVLQAAVDKVSALDYSKYAEELVANVEKNIKSFLGKSILFIEKDLLLSEDVFDNTDNPSYDSIVSQVYNAMYGKFDEFVDGCVELETQKILSEIKETLDGQGN